MGETMPLTDQQDLTGVPGLQSVTVPGQVREKWGEGWGGGWGSL